MRALLVAAVVALFSATVFAGGTSPLKQRKEALQNALAEYAFALCGKDRVFVLSESTVVLVGRADGQTNFNLTITGERCEALPKVSSAAR